MNIILDSDLENEVLTTLRSHGISHYTVFEDVKGVGRSGPKYNDQVGPGINKVIYTIIEDERVTGIISSLRKIKENDKIRMTLKAFVSPVEQFI